MIRYLLALVILAPLCVLPACSKPIPEDAGFAIENASKFELFSLDPFPEKRADRKRNFRRWSVLGSTVIKDPEIRDRLIAEFKAAVAEHRGGAESCFNPRHGFKTVHDGSTHEFVVCFECEQVRWYIDGEETSGFLISDSPEASFDAILQNAKIPLAEKSQK